MPKKKKSVAGDLERSIGIRATNDLAIRFGRYLNDTQQTKQDFLTKLIEATLKRAGYGPAEKRNS